MQKNEEKQTPFRCYTDLLSFPIISADRTEHSRSCLCVRRFIMAREFARDFYSSARWQSCRSEYAEKVHHLCENCLRKGLLVPGEIVHHKIPLTPSNINNPEITLNHLNLEMLCRNCHAEEHDTRSSWSKVNAKRRQAKAAERRYIINKDGSVIAYEPRTEP